MNFRTKISIKQEQNTINYQSKIVLLGSCFTQNIGDKLAFYKFKTLINPLGILFHPAAIAKIISASLENQFFTEKDLIFHEERWHCLDIHSVFSSKDKLVVLQQANESLQKTNKAITNASHIFITLGTAWVYRFLKTNKIVANCHKIPQKKFQKELLSVDEIKTSLATIIAKVKKVNPKASIVFTVSPVRHLKDGFIENQLSKAHLLTAIHQLNTSYFPAYEIQMDDLRDYRFYKKDMIHPNELSIDYIWKKFAETWIDFSEKEIMNQINQIQKGLAHKPFNFQSKKHQLFLDSLKKKIKILEKTKGIVFT